MNWKKIIAYVLAGSMFFSGCREKNKNANSGVISENSKNNYTNSSFLETAEKNINDEEEQVIKDNNETMSADDIIIETVSESKENTYENENLIVYATTNVNIRSSNTTGSLKIGSFKMYDSAYKILCCDNNWDLIKYNNQIGFVCRDYLEYSDDKYKLDYEYEKHNDIVLTTTKLNFRTDPNTEKERISRFDKNTELQVIAKVNNGWLLVKNNGVLGFVHGDYTISLCDKIKQEFPKLNLTEIDVKKIVYSTTDLNIRNGNSTDYDKIGKLEKYESVRVIEEYDNWYFVMTNEYKFGFINKAYTKDLDDTFVVVDLSEQRLYMYNNDELYYITPVTTGKDSTPSDIGLFEIYSKETDRYLTGDDYKAFVNYWMPYNRGEGLHDASWRNVFGTQNYKTSGSHGCINIPPEIADNIYENSKVGTKVLVHK